MEIISILFVLVLLTDKSFQSTIVNKRYSLTSFGDNQCSGDPTIFETSARSKLQCSIICSGYPGCRSFNFRSFDEVCQLLVNGYSINVMQTPGCSYFEVGFSAHKTIMIPLIFLFIFYSETAWQCTKFVSKFQWNVNGHKTQHQKIFFRQSCHPNLEFFASRNCYGPFHILF